MGPAFSFGVRFQEVSASASVPASVPAWAEWVPTVTSQDPAAPWLSLASSVPGLAYLGCPSLPP